MFQEFNWTLPSNMGTMYDDDYVFLDETENFDDVLDQVSWSLFYHIRALQDATSSRLFQPWPRLAW